MFSAFLTSTLFSGRSLKHHVSPSEKNTAIAHEFTIVKCLLSEVVFMFSIIILKNKTSLISLQEEKKSVRAALTLVFNGTLAKPIDLLA